MGNSFDKFAGGNNYNTNANTCRGWSRRRRRRLTAAATPSAVAAAAASSAATSLPSSVLAPTDVALGCNANNNSRRCLLTHVSSTPNLGETTTSNDALEPRSSSFSYAGDTDFGDSNDGMDSDTSTSSSNSKQVVVGICAMAKKTQSKPMKEILTRLGEFEFIKLVTFEENVILREPVQNWPICDCLVSFHSKGFPLEKAIEYAQLRNPFVLNNLHMQYDIQDRRRVYAILEKEGIEIPRYAVLDRDSPDPKHHELIESEDHVEVNGITFNKPFVEKPVSAEDHNIYIYYPTSAGGGSQRLFRKIGSRSSVYSPESRVRKTGSFIYEDFMPTDVYFSGTDVKVYTVGPDYAHAEARKSPALDGKVERDSEGKEIRYPVILNHSEKLISRKVCLAFKQTVCGFDLLRANGKSYVCDVNGFSFVKNSNKYYDDCAKILGNMILRELTPTLHIPWSVPFQLDDPPIVPTTFGKMMELRCVVAVIRHGDRTPKQKMKVEVRHPKFFEIFEKYDGYKLGHVKLKRPKQLQEILDIARFLLSEIHTKAHAEIEEKESKLEQLKNVLEMYGHFSGINRKVQMKYQPKGRPRGSSSDDVLSVSVETPAEPSLVLILKWGGELTPAGRIQAEELGRIFRCMYPGGQGRSDYSGTQGLGLLRLHSTFRHDLKIYASDEGRVQMTAAAFAKGLLALEGELTPILVQMVKSANTNGLLDNDCDSSKYQNLAKGRLHELMQNDREFTPEDRELINPCKSKSITQALDFVKNPVDCCHHVHLLIRELLHIISIKKDDPKTKDAILYHGETWDLMRCRWEKIEKDFSTKSKLFDISKIPDIYDCIKYDLQHNQHTLQYDQAEELYIYAKNLADIVIPQEYGLTPQEKLAIGQGICSPLLRKIKGDLQRNIDEVEDEFMNRLNPHYSHGVASPQRHVRTRLYFTSESHVHSLLTVLRYGGLLNVVTDEQWRRAMDYISMVSELNYMSQIVIMLYEDPTKDPSSEERFHVELHFSPGVNCCVQKNLPPGPGFRPHSHGDNSCSVSLQSSDETNPSRIEEENDYGSNDEQQSKKRACNQRNSSGNSFGFNRLELRSKQLKSKPIPIGAHHTVSGHEAMDLAKRLNEELASQQQQQQQQLQLQQNNQQLQHHQHQQQHQQQQQSSQLRPISPDMRSVSPDCEPRSRSFEQRGSPSANRGKEAATAATTFDEIANARVGLGVGVARGKRGGIDSSSQRASLQIRVTDRLSFFKIDSSTNELPLSDIDFSLTPGTPGQCATASGSPLAQCGTARSSAGHKRHTMLSMRRMISGEEGEFEGLPPLQQLQQISPMATNERPMSCNCSNSLSFPLATAHAHSKSLMQLTPPPATTATTTTTTVEVASSVNRSSAIAVRMASSFDDDFQLSSSAPALLLSGEFGQRSTSFNNNSNREQPRTLQPQNKSSNSANNSPTASTLRLCMDMETRQLERGQQRKATSHSCGQLSIAIAATSSLSAPVQCENPFRFGFASSAAATTCVAAAATVAAGNTFVSCFAPIAEHVPATPTPVATPTLVYNIPTVLITATAATVTSNAAASAAIATDTTDATDSNSKATTAITTATTTTTTTIVALSSITTTITTTTTTATAMSPNQPCTNQFKPIDPSSIDAQQQPQHDIIDNIIQTNNTNTTKTNTTMNNNNNNYYNNNNITTTTTTTTTTTPSCCCTNTIATDSNVSVSVSASVVSSSANSSTSSRRQRHSIAGQMSYMKMLGFGGFSKKMATSANSLFSTAVISGSSSAPNLRDMIPVSSSGFGDVPPIRPLETLHNALSLRKLDSFLQDMILAQIFKTPTGSPPRVHDATGANASSSLATTTSNTPSVDNMTAVSSMIVRHDQHQQQHQQVAGRRAELQTTGGSETHATRRKMVSLCENAMEENVHEVKLEDEVQKLQQQQQQQSSKKERKLQKLWQVQQDYDEDNDDEPLENAAKLSSLAVDIVMIEETDVDEQRTAFEPMNQDTLQTDAAAVAPNANANIFLSVCDEPEPTSSACLTPVSCGMDLDLDLSMVANKGSMTLSVDGFDDDEEATLSAATTPSLPPDATEPKLEMCYCCPTHAEQPPEVASDDPKYCFALPVHITQASPEHTRPSVRRAHDPISPRMQKQISLFECGGGGGAEALRASINLPAAAQQLRQDARLRKFENLTQSTSNSNFPFESNTLKRVPLVSTKDDYANVSHTQSCINLKSSGAGSGSGSLGYGSPQHQRESKDKDKEKERLPTTLANTPNYNRLPNALSVCCSLDIDAGCSSTATSTAAGGGGGGGGAAPTQTVPSASSASPAAPHPGALIVKERFIEPPKRGIVRGYHGKTQSMDADFLFNEFLLLPAMAPQLDDDLDVEQMEQATDAALPSPK
ncbi:inositol hexakisphosphate and diphosphoinositol-pentakisphosphate kinase isoform X1 [Drosophila nasuta]|uniref:inositol hexakisphosphate and diphosphoinositol-pentakisphosphate kinase isoform X1 n=1 Tax=Drosophila nasuta TaxID=42062 RepID=UPI00295EA4EF|nr:inositol hexakisphosphate and diphosphoinositol-pentakisphosphate kinase isoform X1 [Drosophila nasuta]